MMALAGIPPFVGFTGEFMLMASALQAGHLTLVILAALNAAIAIYYYLSILKVTYCDAPEPNGAIVIGLPTKAVSLLLIAAIITMGVIPSSVLEIANRAVNALL